QRAVGRLVGHHQIQHLAPYLVRILGQRDVQRRGIALQAGPVAVPGERNSIGNAQGTEDAPTGEQPYLSWSQAKVGGFLNLVIMQNELVQHPLILPCRRSETHAPVQFGNGLMRDSRQASISVGNRARRSKSCSSSLSSASSSPSIQLGGIPFQAWSMTSSGKCTIWSSHGCRSSSDRTAS